MARRNFSVIIPDNPDRLLALATTILQKHEQDGAASRLSTTFTQPLQALLATARIENDRRNELDRQKEKQNEARNLILGLHHSQNAFTPGTVLYYVAAARDLLLGEYRGSERVLGDWGFTVDSPKNAVRVVIRRSADALIVLAKNVLRKHQQDGANSLLLPLDLSTLELRLVEAEEKLQAGRALNRDKEKATQARNIVLGIDKGQTSKTPNTVKYLVKSIRDVLLGIYRGREQELGAWGFEVNAHTATTEAATPVKELTPTG
jgi:co-chaperonin GroES (HSP10)